MSGILGLLRRNGRKADAATLARMGAAMAHRGPQGFVNVSSGSAGLGHGLLAVASNSLTVGTNQVTVTLDGRFDNRGVLCAQLSQARDTSDASLLLAAYQKWGPRCAEHLLGDFAFAIWDPQTQQLVCARDHFGVRPLYYHSSGELFVFASEIKAILRAKPALRDRLNDEWLGDYIINQPPGEEATLYSDIQRLPPGHICVATPDKTTLFAYYRLEERPAIPRSDWPAELVHHLKTAIECRLSSPTPVCAMLSGGLDSSSIVSLAAPMVCTDGGRLTTISLVYPATPEHDERRFIDEVVKIGNVEPVFLDSSNFMPFQQFADVLDEQDGPFLAPNLAASRQLHHAASSRGFGVILDGHGGDEIISSGMGLLNDLAYSGRWVTLWSELAQLAANQDVAPAPVFLDMLWRKGPHRKFAHKTRDFLRLFPGRRKSTVLRHLDAVAPRFATRAGLPNRHPTLTTPLSSMGREERHHHYSDVSSRIQSYALEILDHNSAGAGVETRFPFFDKRLVEFCLSLPAGERMGGGFTRRVLRQSLHDVLPKAIRERHDKLNFIPHIVRGMVEHHSALIESLLVDERNLGTFVNLPVVRLAWARIRAAKTSANGYDVQLVWRVVSLGIWLRRGVR